MILVLVFYLVQTTDSMKTWIKYILILLVVLLGVCVTQAIVVSTKYRKLEPRQNLRGTKAAELTAVSRMDCAGM